MVNFLSLVFFSPPVIYSVTPNSGPTMLSVVLDTTATAILSERSWSVRVMQFECDSMSVGEFLFRILYCGNFLAFQVKILFNLEIDTPAFLRFKSNLSTSVLFRFWRNYLGNSIYFHAKKYWVIVLCEKWVFLPLLSSPCGLPAVLHRRDGRPPLLQLPPRRQRQQRPQPPGQPQLRHLHQGRQRLLRSKVHAGGRANIRNCFVILF